MSSSFPEQQATSSSGFDDILESLLPESAGTDGTPTEAFKEEGYTGDIDYRIRQLSYSSLLTLHSCPRKFELYKKKSTHKTEEAEESSITFAYGHVIGQGIQDILCGKPIDEVIVNAFVMWKPELFAADEKRNKSFWLALNAVQKFYSLREQGFLEDYELVYYKDLPAVELSFCINFPDGFRLRGFVDGVLRHRETGEIIVLECKTTAIKLNPSVYKNSAQAIGYSIVLDNLFPELSSYKVLYLVYHSKDEEFTPFTFPKTYLQRALWIKELLLDIEMIKLYEEEQVYPMHGESCLSWGKECEYFQTCTLSTQYLTNLPTAADEDKTEYMVNLSLMDLLESQFEKIGE